MWTDVRHGAPSSPPSSAAATWLRLLTGAALVALPQRTVTRGVAVGVAFGALAALANAALVASTGGAVLATYLAMGQVLAVGVAVALVGELAGGLVRGVVG